MKRMKKNKSQLKELDKKLKAINMRCKTMGFMLGKP
jgi:hypothetical protein